MNSDWFENKNSLYNKIGHKAFFLFLTLFRFRVPEQEVRHQFITSISLIRKCTEYTSQEVLDLLLKLKRYKLINIEGYSRTEYFYDNDKKVKDKECLVINCDLNNNEWEFNIPIDLKMIQHYINCGLNEKYVGLYCLLRKLSNSNVERKSYMSIENMAAVLGIDKDTVHDMIYELNKKYLLYSWKVKIKDQKGNKTKRERFEHKLCYDYGILDKFKKEYGNKIDKNMEKWRKGDQ